MTTAEVLDQLTALSLRDRLTVLETALHRIREELSAYEAPGTVPREAPAMVPGAGSAAADVEVAFARRFPHLPTLNEGQIHEDPTLPLTPEDWEDLGG